VALEVNGAGEENAARDQDYATAGGSAGIDGFGDGGGAIGAAGSRAVAGDIEGAIGEFRGMDAPQDRGHGRRIVRECGPERQCGRGAEQFSSGHVSDCNILLRQDIRCVSFRAQWRRKCAREHLWRHRECPLTKPYAI
jgi:hypothetical protein